MSITFQKRQKELKRQEKQRAKAKRREQRKAVKRAEKDAQVLPLTASGPKPKRHIIDAAAFSSPLRRFSIARSPNKTEQRNPCDKTLCRKSLLWHDG